MRPGCESLNLIPGVSDYDVHFNRRITAKALTMWAQLGNGGPKTVSSSLMVSYTSLKYNLESWDRIGFGLRSSSSAREITAEKQHNAPALMSWFRLGQS